MLDSRCLFGLVCKHYSWNDRYKYSTVYHDGAMSINNGGPKFMWICFGSDDGVHQWLLTLSQRRSREKTSTDPITRANILSAFRSCAVRIFCVFGMLMRFCRYTFRCSRLRLVQHQNDAHSKARCCSLRFSFAYLNLICHLFTRSRWRI